MTRPLHIPRSPRAPLVIGAVAVLLLAAPQAAPDQPRRITTDHAAAAQPAPTQAPPGATAAKPRIDDAEIGEHIWAAWRGSTAIPPAIRRGLRAGRIGGLVLFTDDVPTPTATAYAALARRLQAEAQAGGRRRPLIAIDQEGGAVRRLAGPPAQDAADTRGDWYTRMTAARHAGEYLASARIDVDLAPVSDVPSVPSAFIGRRAFAADPALAAGAVSAFVSGLGQGGIAATLKHYPGLGGATVSTDEQPVQIVLSRKALRAAEAPFVAGIAVGAPLVMMSSATYPALDPDRPAVFSSRIIGRLRRTLGFEGVIISDALDTPATAAYGADAAVRAGTDVVLYANSDGSAAFSALRHALDAGTLSAHRFHASTLRVRELR